MFSFSYPAFVREFQAVVAELKLKNVVPYQLRHSGPSVGASTGTWNWPKNLVNTRAKTTTPPILTQMLVRSASAAT